MAAIAIIPGHEYEVAGDGAVWHEGRLLNGVWLSPDGEAWAGLIKSDSAGSWVSLADDGDGSFVAANNNWDSCIVREIPPINAAALWSAA